MATFDQLREGLNHSWRHLRDGWRQLFERSQGALTRFIPSRKTDKGENTSLIHGGPEWGLMAAEVYEEKDKIIVNIELPGMEPEDFDIQVHEDVLIVRGEKKIQRERNEGRYFLSECAYGRFERAIPLPNAVDDTKTTARYRNGLLRIELPVTGHPTRHTIKVEA